MERVNMMAKVRWTANSKKVTKVALKKVVKTGNSNQLIEEETEL